MFEDLFSKKGLSLDRLRSFLAFAEAGSIAKAAPRDVTLQSQISRQIGELETFFGTELTQRRGKVLSLSESGKRLALLVRQQLQDLDDFRREQLLLKRSFTVGAGASILDWIVIPALPALGGALSNSSLRLETSRSAALVEAVKDGRVDFAIVRDDAIPQSLPRILVHQLSFHLCVPRSLLKPGTSVRSLSDSSVLQGLPFAAGKDGGQLNTAVRQAMQAAGIDFQPTVECTSLLQLKQLIEQGTCAGVLPSIGIRGLSRKLIHTCEFEPLQEYSRSLVLHWNERQMLRRGVERTVIRHVAKALVA
ncbi:MAG: LysR family transcriptional regulator [Verrucomicrobiota bacterium]